MKVSGWTRPKTLWEERICNLCDTKKAENEKHSLRLTSYAHTASQFHNICNTTHLDTKMVESEKDSLRFSFYAHTRSQLHNICSSTNLHNLLTHETKEVY
jgi:hypothetical protein